MSKDRKDERVDSHPLGEKALEASHVGQVKLSPSGKLGELESAGQQVPAKQPYPWYIAFILGNEFCERFSYYGMKTVLTIYFLDIMLWSEGTATLVYHLFSVLCYFTPIFGAMLADGFLGKFNTIFTLSLVYVAGLILLTLASVPPANLELMSATAAGLILIGFGTGGIKPVVPAYGGDQFKPGQEKQREGFFSIFYFCINAGSLISTFVTPILRSDVSCFDKEGCYPLAFGLPAGLMVVALIAFAAGRPFYSNVPSKVNIIAKVFGVCFHAIANKFRSRGGRGPTKKHWLDHAEDRYERDFIKDVKQLLPVLTMFIPLPVFWALYDQQGSRWTVQATKMDGRVTDDYTWKPDQMQIFNPILILIMIPIFEGGIFRVLDKYKIPFKALARLNAGMIFAALSFVVAGVMQMELEKTLPSLVTPGRAELRLYNTLPDCNLTVHANFTQYSDRFGTDDDLQSLDLYNRKQVAFAQKEKYGEVHLPPGVTFAPFNIRVASNGSCPGMSSNEGFYNLNMTEKNVHSILIGQSNGVFAFQNLTIEEKVKPKEGRVFVQFVPAFRFPTESGGGEVVLVNEGLTAGTKGHMYILNFERAAGLFGPNKSPLVNVSMTLEQGRYAVYYPNRNDTKGKHRLDQALTLDNGGVFTVVFRDDVNFTATEEYPNPWDLFKIVPPSSLSVFLQLPQIFVMTIGEVLFSVSGLSFAYSQSPASMKSVLQAGWLMAVAVGNVIVIIISGAQLIADQATEFFVFAGLMVLASIAFGIMSRYYKYVDTDKKDDEMHPVKEETDSM